MNENLPEISRLPEAPFRAVISPIAFVFMSLASLALSGCSSGDNSVPALKSQALLGEALFFDVNLSLNRTQSCATCHDPERAFVDGRVGDDGQIRAVSLGDDGISLGDRNAPTAAYAMFNPAFHYGTHARFNSQQGDYEGFIGGQFHDGRAPGLEEQAEGPPVNPIEMGMPDKASVVERIRENPDYVDSFEYLFGNTVFNEVDTAYAAAADAIAEFERSEEFAPFNSIYDRVLAGEWEADDPNHLYNPLSKAAQGKALFFSQQFTNCATCHQLRPNSSTDEVFTNHEFHNIGIPVNEAVRAANGAADEFLDNGLLDNPAVVDESQRGKFKVPTLRNVAVTGPYMHNGVFRELRTVIQFYDHFLTGSEFTNNPETGKPWRSPEIADTISLAELEDGRTLSANEVDAIVCFLRTLTDARYEHLIEDQGVDCSQ